MLKSISQKITRLETTFLAENKSLHKQILDLNLQLIKTEASIFRMCTSCKKFNIYTNAPSYKIICVDCFRKKKLKETKALKLIKKKAKEEEEELVESITNNE